MRYFLAILLVVLIGVMSATTIYDVQYTTDAGADGTYPSTMVGEEVILEGVVTANNVSGDKFYISEPQGGAWRGIFIYDYTVLPQIGDHVSVTGSVAEYNGSTQLSSITTGTILSSGNPLPNPTVITTGSLSNDSTAEQYESVLVAVSRGAVTSVPNTYNEFEINDGTGNCFVDDFLYYHIPAVDDMLDIIGIGNYYYNFKILPRSAQDILPYGTSNAKKSWGRIKSIYR